MRRLCGFRRPAIAVAALWFGFSEGSLRAQTLKSTILGTVTDTSGRVIPKAQIAVTETKTNSRRTAETNESGFFAIPNLDPGVYRVDAEHSGFRKIVRAGIDLPPNNTARVDLELSPGAVSEVVEVTGTAALLPTDRSDTGGQLQTTELQNMPLAYNRNYQGLLMTVPGISRSFRTRSEFFNSQDSLSNRVNGQTQLDNNVQIEGIDNNLEFGDLTGIVPPIEAIQTVDVSTTNYDPEFGRAGGAVTNLTLISGTNRFHSTLFYFHKNENMQALDVFATVKPPTVYNQFGGTLGGPIKKDKTFFFTDYQGSRDHKGGNNLVTIPNMPFRTGDFSNAPSIIYDPLTGTVDGRNRTMFT